MRNMIFSDQTMPILALLTMAASVGSCSSEQGTAGTKPDGGRDAASGGSGGGAGRAGSGGQADAGDGRAGTGGHAGSGGQDGRAGSPPAVTITSPADNARIVGTRTVTLSGTLSDTDQIASVTVALNGKDVTGVTFDQVSFSASIQLANRANTVDVTATDESGLNGSATIHLDYPFVAIPTFRAASVVIGQPNFSVQMPNRGGQANANTIFWPFGSPTFSNGGLFLPDSANNRVLGFDSVPPANEASANFVLGQPSFVSRTQGSGLLMRIPRTARVSGGKLFVTDALNYRVLIWNTVPSSTQAPPDLAVGQTDLNGSSSGCAANRLNEPYSVFVAGDKMIVTDTMNARVLIWNTVPTQNNVAADIVLGQPDFVTCAVPATDSSRTLLMPTDAWSDGTKLVIVDSAAHRVLLWDTFPTANHTPANRVLGQPDMTTRTVPTAASSVVLKYPRAIASNGNQLFVSDAGFNRVLVWNSFPVANQAPADVALGQADLTHGVYNDDNQDGVADTNPTERTLHSPLGVAVSDTKLIVGDSENNRYLIFTE